MATEPAKTYTPYRVVPLLHDEANAKGENVGGMIIRIVQGTDLHGAKEVARVAFERKQSTAPKSNYLKQVDKYMATAQATCDKLNTALSEVATEKAVALQNQVKILEDLETTLQTKKTEISKLLQDITGDGTLR